MNILVTGANGQLGSCIRDCDKNQNDNYFYTDIQELDITDEDAVFSFIKDNKIDIVINCAAYTNVDKAEEPEEYELVNKLNHLAVKYIANASKCLGATVIHISTDYVFGGNINNTPCDETQKTNPTGVYGKTKLAGEEALASSGCKYLIFRTAWLYSEYGRNFVKTMLSLTSTRDELKVVFDQCGTPTYAPDLANAIVGLINNRSIEGNEGLYHFSNEGVCSWYDFTKEIQRISGNESCRVLPCHSGEFPSKVKRPSYSVLDKTKYKKVFKRTIPYWIDSLNICLNNLKSYK